MAIPEQQLATWSSQGAIAGSRDTYATVKRALEANDTEYAHNRFEVFLQGSYRNDTNVFAESDVDVVICLNTVFYYDLTPMTQPEQAAFRQAHPNSIDPFTAFKAQVTKTLQGRFGVGVTPGPKAIKVPADGARRNADVIVAAEFRRYHRFVSLYDRTFDDGICFFTDKGVRIANYPKQHSENCTTKHQDTNNRYKPAVRILKNMRRHLVNINALDDGIAPSYFLEGLLYNVPNSCFGNTYQDTLLQVLKYLIASDRSKLVCANNEYYLLGHLPVQWPADNCQRFLDEAVKLWNGWR
jgi:hypothetical protein